MRKPDRPNHPPRRASHSRVRSVAGCRFGVEVEVRVGDALPGRVVYEHLLVNEGVHDMQARRSRRRCPPASGWSRPGRSPHRAPAPRSRGVHGDGRKGHGRHGRVCRTSASRRRGSTGRTCSCVTRSTAGRVRVADPPRSDVRRPCCRRRHLSSLAGPAQDLTPSSECPTTIHRSGLQIPRPLIRIIGHCGPHEHAGARMLRGTETAILTKGHGTPWHSR